MFLLLTGICKTTGMTGSRDDSPISGTEFKVRRFALGVEQPLLIEKLGVQRAAVDKWQRGKVQVPKRARELIELIEDDVEAVVQDFVARKPRLLRSEIPAKWEWGESVWFVALARARYELAVAGLHVEIIGEEWVSGSNTIEVDFKNKGASQNSW